MHSMTFSNSKRTEMDADEKIAVMVKIYPELPI